MKSKSFTYTEPMYTCRAAVIWLSGTCSALAFSRLKRTTYCGSLALNWVNRPRRLGLLLPAWITPLRGGGKVLHLAAGQILHDEFETAECSQSLHGRRREGNHVGAGDSSERDRASD